MTALKQNTIQVYTDRGPCILRQRQAFTSYAHAHVSATEFALRMQAEVNNEEGGSIHPRTLRACGSCGMHECMRVFTCIIIRLYMYNIIIAPFRGRYETHKAALWYKKTLHKAAVWYKTLLTCSMYRYDSLCVFMKISEDQPFLQQNMPRAA